MKKILSRSRMVTLMIALLPVFAVIVPAQSNIAIDAITCETNGIRLRIGYPDDFANCLEIFVCTNMAAGGWTVAATNLSTAGTNTICWRDAGVNNASVRFYAVGNADVDSDFDGLTDAREEYLYHTSATNRDSDGDGLVDGPDGVVSVSAYPDGADADHDGFVDGEQTYGTAANNADTDGDGYLDGWEAAQGYDPLNSTSPNPETGAIYITYPIGTNNPLISLYWPSLTKTCSMSELTAGVVQHIEGTVNAAVDNAPFLGQ